VQATPKQNLLPLPSVNLQELDSSDEQERKNFVGNSIYSIIQNFVGEKNAGQVTGMLLDEEVVDFKTLLTDQQYFTEKVTQARDELMKMGQAQAQ